MNIWALDKDESIKCLLLLLQQSFGAEQLYIMDSDCLHPKAVRLGDKASPATAYLYTYGQAESRYGLHLEYPRLEESNISELEDMYEDVDYDNLLEMLKVHFSWQQR